MRWDPVEGGFANARELLTFLGAPKLDGESYEVHYFDFSLPAGAIPNSTVILRERKSADGKTEIRLKYRSLLPPSEKCACPAGAHYKQSEEVDISFGRTGAPSRVYSYSCTIRADEPPASLAAIPKKCESHMVRYVFGGYKIEEWTLPGGNLQLEVSRAAPNTANELARFAQFVAQLRDHGVKPSDRSKSEMGSDCLEGGAVRNTKQSDLQRFRRLEN